MPVAPSRPARRRAVLLGAVALVVAATAALVAVAGGGEDRPPAAPPEVRRGGPPWTVAPYEGLAAWVDTFDFLPSYPQAGDPPAVRPEHMGAVAALGADTLFLQANAGDAEGVIEPAVVGEMLVAAHEAGLQVVAWYLPLLSDLERDIGRARALRDFRHDGHGFDGLVIDIEWISSVPDAGERSARLVEYTRRLDTVVGAEVVGAAVMPPVQIEDVNPAFWPGFPWREIADVYDVWLPMGYWSVRRAPWDDAGLYTAENVRRLRERVGRPDALVHPIGGVADGSTEADYDAFVDAAEAAGAIGWSVYDFRTLTTTGWLRLVPR